MALLTDEQVGLQPAQQFALSSRPQAVPQAPPLQQPPQSNQPVLLSDAQVGLTPPALQPVLNSDRSLNAPMVSTPGMTAPQPVQGQQFTAPPVMRPEQSGSGALPIGTDMRPAAAPGMAHPTDFINLPKSLGQGVTGVLNLPTLIHNALVKDPAQHYPLPFTEDKTVAAHLGDFIKEVVERVVVPRDQFGVPVHETTPVSEGVGESVKGQVDALTTPEMLSAAPFAAEGQVGKVVAGGVKSAFAGSMLGAVPELTKEAAQTVGDVGRTTQEKAKAVADVVGTGAMGVLGARVGKNAGLHSEDLIGEGKNPLGLRPAIKMKDGEVVSGAQGTTHDMLGVTEGQEKERGFVDKEGKFLSRKKGEADIVQAPSSDLHNDEWRKHEEKTLAINQHGNTHTAIVNIAENPRLFGKDNSALAGVLAENFEHSLPLATIEYDSNQGSFYDSEEHHITIDPTDPTNPLAEAVLHEATHAAVYHAIENPVTADQRAAVKRIESLRHDLTASLPEALRKFWEDELLPLMNKTRAERGRIDFQRANRLLDDKGYSMDLWSQLYPLFNNHEFMAMFSNAAAREWYKQTKASPVGLYETTLGLVRDLLGVEKDTVADHALRTLVQIGQERDTLGGYLNRILPVMQMPSRRLMDDIEGKTTAADLGPDRSWREAFRAQVNKATGVMAPHTSAANEELGNKLTRYGYARIAAPLIGKAEATKVLGSHYNDAKFDEDLARLIVEDRLRARQAQYDEAGEDVQVKRVMTQEEFDAAMERPDLRAALERHIEGPQQELETMHRLLGGKISVAGEQTGAFLNLKALVAPDSDVESFNNMVLGSKKGDVLNPLKKGSALNKEFKGTAEEGYILSYRYMLERAYRANYEEYAKQKLYEEYLKSGLGAEEKPGVKPPTFGGKGSVKIPIERSRGKESKNLWVRADLAGELRQALQTDQPVPKNMLTTIANFLTELGVSGPTDFAFHMSNMLAGLKGAQGGFKSDAADLARKIPLVKFGDMAIRLAKAGVDLWKDSPDTQEALANMAKIGIGREAKMHEGLVTKGLKAVGVGTESAQKYDPNYWSAWMIRTADRAGRLVAKGMFDTLVDKGLAEDTEANRRDFTNRLLGMYNERMMPYYQKWAREAGVSPFVTAGRTFNRLALQRLTASPGFKTTNPEAWAKTRLIEAMGLVGSGLALPIAWNLLMTGQAHPPTLPYAGALALDKDGKEYMDLFQTSLIRRGLRLTGEQDIERDVRHGQPVKPLNVLATLAQGYMAPWEGPAVKFAKVLATGKDTSGFLQSRNPNNYGDNLVAALRLVNPTVAAFFNPDQERTGAKGALKQLEQVAGFKQGQKPTYEQQLGGEGFENMTPGQQAKKVKEVGKDRKPLNDIQRRSIQERSVWENAEKEDKAKAALTDKARGWLEERGLTLPTFSETHEVDKQKVPLTAAQRKVFEPLVFKHYQQAIDKVMGEQNEPTWKPERRAVRFKVAMRLARIAAWQEFLKGEKEKRKQ